MKEYEEEVRMDGRKKEDRWKNRKKKIGKLENGKK
jgi:hypothetical protein